jgi:uncharacterized membrane protein YhaH (DUF805 family)
MDVGQLFFGFSGRVNRAKYWIALLVYFAIGVVMGGLGYATGHNMAVESASGMISIAMLISSVAVSIKRLHDRNKSGWYMLLFYVAPAVLVTGSMMFGAGNAEASTTETGVGLLAIAIGIWALVELGCLRGTIGANAYGTDPIAPEILTPPVRIPH